MTASLVRSMPLARPAIRHLAFATAPSRTISSTSSRFTEHAAPIQPTKYEREHPQPVCRACGVPVESEEAGPKRPSGVLKPVLLLGLATGWILPLTMWWFDPTGTTSGGADERDRLLGGWKSKMVKEGDLEEEETDAQRKEEQAYREKHKDSSRKGSFP